MSGEIARLIHQLRMLSGLRADVPRPEPLRSRVIPHSDRNDNAALKQQPIKVLFFSRNLSHEGASISLKELVCGLLQLGVIAPELISFEDGPLRTGYESLGIKVRVLPNVLPEIFTIKGLDAEVEELSVLIKASGAQLVFANTLLNFASILAAEKAGVPSVWNIRESEPWNRYFRFLPNPVAQRAIAAIGLPTQVIFVANTTRGVWKDFDDAGRFAVIHNALDQSRFLDDLSRDRGSARLSFGWRQDEIVLLCVGTVCERKGQEDALRALRSIADKLTPPVRLVFAGDASDRYALRLRQVAADLCRDSRVRVDFINAEQNIGRCYRAADVFLLCSRVESYPRVILEAMAFGLPIVTTPVFGVAEQLPDREDALFYAPGDITKLGEHFLTFISNSGARRLYGQRAKARFGTMHSMDDMLGAYAKVIRRREGLGAQ